MKFQKFKNKFTAYFAMLVFAIGLNISFAVPASAQTEINRQQVENIIREYLLANPELLYEVQQAFEAKQALQVSAKQQEALETSREFLTQSDYQIVFGDPNAAITVVEFFDYNCHFCQNAASDMQKLVEEDKNIRFVLKEFPVLGPESLEASRISMAVSTVLPEKHAEYHLELLAMHGLKNGQRAMELAVKYGADEAEINRIIENPKIIETIQEVYQVADGLGITGTPSYVVGDQVIFGAVGYEQILAAINGETQ